jgi:hypothetical protein
VMFTALAYCKWNHSVFVILTGIFHSLSTMSSGSSTSFFRLKTALFNIIYMVCFALKHFYIQSQAPKNYFYRYFLS